MNTLEILTAARAKISEEKNWCQGQFASNSQGDETLATGVEACAWCSIGSLRTIPVTDDLVYNTAMDRLSTAMKYNIPDYNDSHTHAEVLAAWDKAIAECAKEGCV